MRLIARFAAVLVVVAMSAPLAAGLSIGLPPASVSIEALDLPVDITRDGGGLNVATPLLGATVVGPETESAPASEPAAVVHSVAVVPHPTAGIAVAAPPLTPPAASAAAWSTVLLIVIERLGVGRALAALYFRVRPGELLDHERREKVISMVRERPGIGPQDIAHALGTGWGVTSYHLDRLERAGLITSQRVGHHRCYFLPGAVPRDAQRHVGLFRADTTRRVATLIAERPGVSQREIGAALGLSASAASKQLARLEAASLVRREPGERGLAVFPEATLATALSA